MSGEFFFMLISLSTFVTAFLLCWVLFADEQLVEEGGYQYTASRRVESKSVLLKIFRPLIVSVGSIIATLPLGDSRDKLEIKLKEAGHPGGLTVDEFHATRVLAIVFLAFAGAYLDFELEMSPILAGGGVLLGLIFPDIKLKGIITKRKSRIFRDLPDTLDTLRLAMDAGLDFGSAMKVVVEKGRSGPLLDELETVERDMALGKTRQDALRQFADRLSMTEINAFVIALIQADQLGASIAPILKVQGEMARKRRWTYAEQVVNKLPMKMLGPLVVCIFPASFIILFTPLVIQWLASGE